MIEIYLFVNPLGPICLETEMELLKYIEKSSVKIQLRVLPLVNMTTIGDIMKRRKIAKNDVAARNKLFSDTYSAALDCKTIQLQGRRRARDFLMKLQQAVGCLKKNYSRKLVEEIVDEIGGDLTMFREDRPSQLVKDLFKADQTIAHEMGIVKHPSGVVYNYACDRDYGVLLEGPEALLDLPLLCQTTEESYRIFHLDGYLKRENERRVVLSSKHLKLV
ncbi:DsbA family protein [Enterococcus mediterraneensis]|uniref:DsbA family protein n=1 Tax=Enterococcus mediterraneensis TaxID=2364791 RepID=UPI000F0552C2|nr:DsbA family protein [Enterococcus mediterraneensis]